MTAVTDGTLLGGRVRYGQPATGFRSGIEPVLLAACVPARPGERVLEGGIGAGAALLCLAARVPGVLGVGVERDLVLVGIAAANARANALSGLRMVAGDVCAAPARGFDHAMANPPYHAPEGTPSAVAARERAKRGEAGLLERWIGGLASALRYRGTLTLVIPAALVGEALAAAERWGCGSPALFPLWPRAGEPAKLVLLRWVRGGRGPFRLLAGLVLHDGAGFTPEADAVLRDGAPILF